MTAATYRETIAPILRLCADNLVATKLLQEALAGGDGLPPRTASARFRQALAETKESLAFKPTLEAPLPEGFPDLTPVGEIRIKQYPKYRLARTSLAGADAEAFWTLFWHIKKKDIAMTAPVEMMYGTTAKEPFQRQTMAFLYRTTKQGSPGKEDKIEVVDVPATLALSFGMRGDGTSARLADAKSYLEAWLKRHAKEYQAVGPLRIMAYNSPFVAADRRYSEVEIPIRRIVPNP